MSIILRGQKGSALTYEELDGNLEQFYISSSLSSNGRVLSLFTSGGEDTVTFPAADTLQSVTDNGNTTTNGITALSIVKSGATSDDILLGDGTTTSLSGIGGSTDTGSLLTTASVNLNEITFTKGDGTTFPILINTGSAESSADTGSLLQTASISDATITFTKGDASTFDITVNKVINAETTAITIKNVWTGTIAKGTPCYITGSGTSGNVAGVVPADAGDISIMPAGVVASEELTNVGDEGIGIISGFIDGIDTSAFSSGDSIYVAEGGGYTNTKPTGSTLIQKLGNVEKVNASNGSGVITGAGRSNDLPNITQGYVWVGNSDGVPVAISTGSLGTGGGVQIFVTGSSGTDSIQTNDSYSSVASANFAFAGGGSNVSASGISSTALGGDTNKALGDYSTVIGGRQNTANFSDSSVFGGRLNISSNLASTVIGGYINSASGESAAVVAGEGNKVKGDYAAIVGGTNHTGSADYSIILGGQDNHTLGIRSAVIGGRGGQAKGSGSVILGGSQNEIDVNGNQSSIIAGSNNTAGHPASSIIAGDNVITSRKFTSFAKSVFVTGSTGEGVADFGGLLQLSRRTTTPQTPEEGMIIHSGSSGASKLYFYNGTNWLVIAGGI